MDCRSTSSRTAALLTAASLAFAGVMAHAPRAQADEVSPTGKGIVGGALLGAEVVVIVESLAGVRKGWAYAVGAGVGAVGGGVGGYFVEQGSTNGRVPVYMLAGGLALVIPAVVLTLNATRYMPDEAASEDRAPTNGPEANPGKAGGSVVIEGGGSTSTTPSTGGTQGGGGTQPSSTPPTDTRTPPTPATPPQSLFDFQGKPRFGIPVPAIQPMFSAKEQKQLAIGNGTELRVPLLNLTF